MTEASEDILGEARWITRDGVRVGYRIAGQQPGRPTLLLFSAWQVVHSAAWRAQIPYLSAFYTVIAIDCRGNGLSDRPETVEAYSPWELVEDAVSILDAEGVGECVIAGFSYGGHLAALFASTYPARCRGAILIAPSAPFGPTFPAFSPENITAVRDTYEGWEKYNFNYWRQNYADGMEFFLRQVFCEPHSEKQIEDALSWAMETDAETMIRTLAARRDTEGQKEEAYRAVSCPVLLFQGTEDRVVPFEKGRMVAELLRAEFVPLEGAGHIPNGRIPALVNARIRAFMDKLFHPPQTGRAQIAPRGLKRPPRALYLSSPIGLGHARRDQAIAEALRRKVPGLTVDWLAQNPVTQFLQAMGEHVHPVSQRLLSESSHIEAESGEHDLHAFQALRRMDAILVANFGHFQEVVDGNEYDLIIADEAWDIDRFWHEHPEMKRGKLTWMTDFVGVLPVEGASDRERALTADWNAEMIGLVERQRHVRDAAIFVGEPGDIVGRTFGPGLPGIRDWCEENFTFAGYPNPFENLFFANGQRRRHELGHGDDALVCLVAVGGSGVGRALISRILAMAPSLRAAIPRLKFEIVTGPRIETDELQAPEGVRLHRFLADFPTMMQACDVALVQGGLSTTMELSCLGKPFLYVPLENHFEQQIHVHHRLQRLGLGQRLPYAQIEDPDALGERILDLARRAAAGRVSPVSNGGVERAARAISALL